MTEHSSASQAVEPLVKLGRQCGGQRPFSFEGGPMGAYHFGLLQAPTPLLSFTLPRTQQPDSATNQPISAAPFQTISARSRKVLPA